MSKSFRIFLILGLVLGLAACSSSRTDEEDLADDIIEEVDAGTDAVPASSVEMPSQAVSAITAPEVPAAPPLPVSQTVIVASESVNVPKVASSGATRGSYIIRPGETLMMIAYQVYGDIFRWKEIYRANKDKIRNPNSLPVGVALTTENIPGGANSPPKGRKYQVKIGDTLRSIARSVYGTQYKWEKIWKNNRQAIKNPNKIFKGFSIYYTMSLKDLAEFRHFKTVAVRYSRPRRVQRFQVQKRRDLSPVVQRPIQPMTQPASVVDTVKTNERATEVSHSSVLVPAAPPASVPTVVAMPPLPSHLNEQLGQ